MESGDDEIPCSQFPLEEGSLAGWLQCRTTLPWMSDDSTQSPFSFCDSTCHCFTYTFLLKISCPLFSRGWLGLGEG